MRNPLVIAAFLVAGCDSDPTEPSCSVPGAITVAVISGPTDMVVDKDLKIRGTATQSAALTIRRVLVAGIAATNDDFNFDNWSVTIPIDTLAGLARANGDTVTVPIDAIDVCGNHPAAPASFDVQVDPTPGIRVTTLAIASSIANNRNFIPANGNVPALLTLTANADAAHAVVALAASVGTFTGATNNQITLEGDGMTPATAVVLFSAVTPTSQAVLITATAKTQIASTTVRVAGPPTLIPSSATLTPGQSVPVTVMTQGSVQACQATPAQNLSITSGGQNLMALPGGTDVNGDHQIDIDVAATATVTAQSTSTVTCTDPYGQASTGTYTAKP